MGRSPELEHVKNMSGTNYLLSEICSVGRCTGARRHNRMALRSASCTVETSTALTIPVRFTIRVVCR